MNNWKTYNLEQLAYYYNGMAFKPDDWKEDGIKIIRIEQLNNPTGHYDYYQGEVSENNEINNEDLIFSWSATLKVAIWKHGYGVLNQHLFKVVPKENTDKYFLYYLLDANMVKLGESSHGLTMKHIKRGELEKFIVLIPENKSEQQKIARILSTADAVIEKTQSAIAKYKAIKQGMLFDLFTRGIDIQTGKLRPRYQDAPELYKESKLGMIPIEWEVEEFQNACSFITDGSHFSPKPQEDGELIVNVKDMGEYDINYSSCTKITIRDFEFLTKQNCSPINGDILLSKDGTIGKTLLFNGKRKVVLLSSIAILRPSELLNSTFFYTYFKCHHFENELRVKISGTAIKRIVLKAINTLNVVLPKSLEEQKLIGKRVISIDNKLQTEQAYLQKMQSLKKGLMEDLLSGRKKITITETI